MFAQVSHGIGCLMYLLLHLSFHLLHHSFLLVIEKKKPLDLKIAILGGVFVGFFCDQ
jgi:hypothetical protein